MAHRSLPQADTDVDPFWHDAARHRSHWREWLDPAVHALRSWAVVGLGLVLLAGVGWWFLRPGTPPVEANLPLAGASTPATGGSAAPEQAGDPGAAPGAATGATTSTSQPAEVVVQAAGAVVRPGVYALPADARVDDLVEAAGGLTKSADRDRVNLAAPLTDGERVWLPAAGEDEVPEVVAGAGGGSGSPSSGATPSSGGTSGGAASGPTVPVDLNSATAVELDALPGVGPATATAILSYRDEHGRFSTVDELLDVRGIGDAKLEQLRPLVRV